MKIKGNEKIFQHPLTKKKKQQTCSLIRKYLKSNDRSANIVTNQMFAFHSPNRPTIPNICTKRKSSTRQRCAIAVRGLRVLIYHPCLTVHSVLIVALFVQNRRSLSRPLCSCFYVDSGAIVIVAAALSLAQWRRRPLSSEPAHKSWKTNVA